MSSTEYWITHFDGVFFKMQTIYDNQIKTLCKCMYSFTLFI